MCERNLENLHVSFERVRMFQSTKHTCHAHRTADKVLCLYLLSTVCSFFIYIHM